MQGDDGEEVKIDEEEELGEDREGENEASNINVMEAPYKPTQKEREEHEVTHCPPKKLV